MKTQIHFSNEGMSRLEKDLRASIRFNEIIFRLKELDINPEEATEYMEDCRDYEKPSPTGKWCVLDKYGRDYPHSDEENALLNEWKEFI